MRPSFTKTHAVSWNYSLGILAVSVSLHEPSLPIRFRLDWQAATYMAEQAAHACCSILESTGPTCSLSRLTLCVSFPSSSAESDGEAVQGESPY